MRNTNATCQCRWGCRGPECSGGVPSVLGIRHSGRAFLHPLKPNIPVPIPVPVHALVCMVCGVRRVPYTAPLCLCWLSCAGSSCRACVGLCASHADSRGDVLHADGIGSASQSDSGGWVVRREVRGRQCSHHPLDADVDGLGVPGTEQSAGIDGAVEGQNARAACPRVGCGMPASE
jgi:hypothetical protein